MKTLLAFLCLLIICFLNGCATGRQGTSADGPSDPSDHWIKGTLTCLENGAVLSFRIQKKAAWGGSATGGVVAINSATKERFTGQYTGMMESGNIIGSATGFAHWQSELANAAATLTNQQGSVIQLQMQIHAGWSPHGIGQGLDNHGNHYQVQF